MKVRACIVLLVTLLCATPAWGAHHPIGSVEERRLVRYVPFQEILIQLIERLHHGLLPEPGEILLFDLPRDEK